MMLLSQEIEVDMEPEPEEPVIKEVPMENVRFLEARKERNGKIARKGRWALLGGAVLDLTAVGALFMGWLSGQCPYSLSFGYFVTFMGCIFMAIEYFWNPGSIFMAIESILFESGRGGLRVTRGTLEELHQPINLTNESTRPPDGIGAEPHQPINPSIE